MKRKVRVLLALAICAMVAVSSIGGLVSAQAAPEVKVEASSHEVNKGEEVEVSINIVQNPGICGLMLSFEYDQEAMTIVEIRGGEVFPIEGTLIPSIGTITSGMFRIEASGLSNNVKTGTFVTLVFQINEDAPVGSHAVNVTAADDAAYNIDEAVVPVTTTNGIVKVLCQHENKTEIITKEPTCTEEGEEKVVCNDCGETVSTNPIGALGHLGKWANVQNPTCTSDGVKELVCERCGEKLEEEILPMLGHEFGEWQVVTEPSCTENGLQERYCLHDECTEKETAEIDPLGHVGSEWKVTLDPTCTEEGQSTLFCDRCEAAIQTKAIDALGHDWGEWIVEKEATFHEEGSEYRLCNRCLQREDKVLPALSESHECEFAGKEEIIMEPSCTEPGMKHIYCSNEECGKYVEESVPATGHTPEEEWIVLEAAGCEQDGIEIKKCAVCGVEVERQVIDALGHEWEEEILQAPTCTEKGFGKRTCSRCGEVQDIEYEMIPHVEGEWTEQIAPTCTEPGEKELRCKNCGTLLKKVVIDPLGHTWGEWVVKKEATQQEAGLEERTCTVCKAIDQREIAPLDVEEEEPEKTEKPGDQTDSNSDQSSQTPAKTESVKTGDNAASMMTLSVVSVAAVLALIVLIKKRLAA